MEVKSESYIQNNLRNLLLKINTLEENIITANDMMADTYDFFLEKLWLILFQRYSWEHPKVCVNLQTDVR